MDLKRLSKTLSGKDRRAPTPTSPRPSVPDTASWSPTAQITPNHGGKQSCEIHTHKPHTGNRPRQPRKTGRVRRRQAAPCHLRTTTRPGEKWQDTGELPRKQARSLPTFLGTLSPPRPSPAGAQGSAPGPGWGPLREAPPAGQAPRRARGRPGPAAGSRWEVAPCQGHCPPASTHRRCVWFSAASWGCSEEAAEETRSGAPPPGHHTPRASRPGPRPPPPGAVPAPVPRGEPPQPPPCSAARPLAAAAAASAPRAPASASSCRPGPPPGPWLRSRRCRQTRRAERRAAAPIQPAPPRGN
nr:basic proline-rich protein-like [Kogia breviceps]